MMTCFAPFPAQASHIHFVDGASGGYALAAAALKANTVPSVATEPQPAHA